MTYQGHRDSVTSVFLSADGTRLVTGGEGQTAKLLDVQTGRCLVTFHGDARSCYALGYSTLTADGTRLVARFGEYTVGFWDAASGELLVTFHNVGDGFLWTTPPDEESASGWFWTDRTDLIHVLECDKDGGDARALPEDDPRRTKYIAAHNRQDIVMARINDPQKYANLLADIRGAKQSQDLLPSSGTQLRHLLGYEAH